MAYGVHRLLAPTNDKGQQENVVHSPFRSLLHKVYVFAVRMIAVFAMKISNGYESLKAYIRAKPVAFQYERDQYFPTLQQCVKNLNEPQLRVWLSEYSRYNPTQILFGKYFINVEMFSNYAKHELLEAAQGRTEEEIVQAVNRFFDGRIRCMAKLFHPDRHVGSNIDPLLMHQCASLITSAKTKLQENRI